ncbi:hypothetical protein AURDEDRAFT_177150 [Auricularia subglabra TFB-10046 SS5]|uniref:Uncharacterized protein n=1 Tax=Auricularia subglabra (strain TFB-10046 / SS5) TaxID=717982 RepID=J0WPH6_AURST|nr:hypothetical protein AURDEDRAFT_177150 [Auricularia subglabra TFB-10046 SS5]
MFVRKLFIFPSSRATPTAIPPTPRSPVTSDPPFFAGRSGTSNPSRGHRLRDYFSAAACVTQCPATRRPRADRLDGGEKRRGRDRVRRRRCFLVALPIGIGELACFADVQAGPMTELASSSDAGRWISTCAR